MWSLIHISFLSLSLCPLSLRYLFFSERDLGGGGGGGGGKIRKFHQSRGRKRERERARKGGRAGGKKTGRKRNTPRMPKGEGGKKNMPRAFYPPPPRPSFSFPLS